MTITPTTLFRAAAVAAVLAGLIFIGVQIHHPALDATSITTTDVMTRNTLKMLMTALALAGITGMYLRQVTKIGVLDRDQQSPGVHLPPPRLQNGSGARHGAPGGQQSTMPLVHPSGVPSPQSFELASASLAASLIALSPPPSPPPSPPVEASLPVVTSLPHATIAPSRASDDKNAPGLFFIHEA